MALGPDVIAEPGDETIDAGGAPLVAPLVNGHTHAAMTLFRGSGGDLPLMPWLGERIWPVEAKLEAEDVYWGARLACAEMIRTGTTRFWDMYWHPEATARAVADAGLRATIGGAAVRPDGDAEAMQERALRASTRWPSSAPAIDAGARPALDLHGQRGARCAGSPSSAPSARCRSRSTSPRPSRRSRTASPPTACARPPTSTGWACWASAPSSPTASGSTQSELELIAERGCTVVTNPVANMKLAVGGVFPYPAARGAPGSRSGSAPTAPAPTTRSTCSPT